MTNNVKNQVQCSACNTGMAAEAKFCPNCGQSTQPKAPIAETTFTNKCDILGEFWITYKHSSFYASVIEFCDLGLPIAYAISHGIVESSPEAENYINESFEMLLSFLEEEDVGYEDISDLIPYEED
jgi:hypothetical protein